MLISQPQRTESKNEKTGSKKHMKRHRFRVVWKGTMYIIGFPDRKIFNLKKTFYFGNIGVSVGREKWLAGFRSHNGPFRFPNGGTVHYTATSNTERLHTQCSRSPCLMGSVPTRLESDEVECSHLRTHSHSWPITNAFYHPIPHKTMRIG